MKQLEYMIKSIIFELVNDGSLQAGLKECEGDDYLGKNRRIVVCDALADMICKLIEEGVICIPKVEALTMDCDTKVLSLSMAGGLTLDADLSCLGGGGGGIPDGNTRIQSTNYDAATGLFTILDTDGNSFTATITTSSGTDTTNTRMDWNSATQVISVTDSASNTVSVPVVFAADQAPAGTDSVPTPVRFLGASGATMLGEPHHWIRMLLPNGTVVRIPAYVDDTQVTRFIPRVLIDDAGNTTTNIPLYALMSDGGELTDLDTGAAVQNLNFDSANPASITDLIDGLRRRFPNASHALTAFGWLDLSQTLMQPELYFVQGTFIKDPTGVYRFRQDGAVVTLLSGTDWVWSYPALGTFPVKVYRTTNTGGANINTTETLYAQHDFYTELPKQDSGNVASASGLHKWRQAIINAMPTDPNYASSVRFIETPWGTYKGDRLYPSNDLTLYENGAVTEEVQPSGEREWALSQTAFAQFAYDHTAETLDPPFPLFW